MRQLPVPGCSDIDIFDALIAAKEHPTSHYLANARLRVLAAYANYVEVAPEFGNLGDVILNDDELAALRHCYDVETRPIAQLREELFGPLASVRCPYCGIGESSTLDHYLPKQDFAQFSTLSKNLIPCCAKCNNTKRRKVIDEATQIRIFLHPYFDHIPAMQFIELDVTIKHEEILLNFDIFHPAGMGANTHVHISNHFNVLGLRNRYRINSLDHLKANHKTFTRWYGSTGNAQRLADELSRQADETADWYGVNHWQPVLYRTLSKDHAFCDGGFNAIAFHH